MATSKPILKTVALSAIHPNPDNIRDLSGIEELAELIKGQGLLVMPKVFPHPSLEGDWMLIDGHRRLAASRIAGLTEMHVEAHPEMTRVEALHIMISTGRGNKTATDAEVSKGVQGLLDLGESVTKVAKAQRISLDEVRTRSWVMSREDKVNECYSKGIMPLDAVAEMQTLDKEAGSTGLYERTVKDFDKIPGGPTAAAIQEVIAEKKIEIEVENTQKALDECGAVEAPGWARWNASQWEPIGEGPESFATHVASGHEYLLGGTGAVEWFANKAADQPVEVSEPTPEEIAAEENIQRMQSNLRRLNLTRPRNVAKLLRAKDLKEDLAKQLLIEEIMEYVHRSELVALLISKAMPEQEENEAEESYEERLEKWEAQGRRSLKRLSLVQLVMTNKTLEAENVTRSLGELRGYARSESEDQSWHVWNKNYRYFKVIVDCLGYELSPDEVEVLQLAGKENDGRLREFDLVPVPDKVTATCKDCSQEVVADSEWDGQCVNCIDDAGDSE